MKAKFLFFSYLLACSLATYAQVQRVEPASWWIGMKNPEVQLLLYGKNLAPATVSTDYKGITIEKVASVANPNYLFVNLTIAPTSKAGKAVFKLKKENDKIETFTFDLLERMPNSANRKGYDASDAIYLITPDRFANGNTANDNASDMAEKLNREDKDGRHGGDIEGIIQHLDYMRDMGFTTIWSMPLMENNSRPPVSVSYHGYGISDFYRTDPRYGTNEDFKRLSEKAQEKGMKLIMDVVLNHCGIDHWWMNDLPSEDWINFKGKFSSANHRRETLQDPYASETDKKNHADGWFVPSMPDLNQRNEFMANYLIQNTIWWIEYAQLAGLRIDTYPYSDKTFLTNWSKRIMNEYPNLNMVGEEWSLSPAVTSFWQRGKQNANGYESHLPSVFDFPLQNALVQALNEDDRIYNQGFTKVYQTLAQDFLYPHPENLVIFPDNHDMSRFYTQIHEDFDLYKMGMVFFATMRGIPQVYYGTEVLLTNPKSDAHGEIRADMPGGWPDDKQNAFTGTNLSPMQAEAQAFVRKLFTWRKNTPTLHTGKLVHFAPENGVYAYARISESERYLIIFNKNKTNTNLNLKRFEEVIKDTKQATNVLEDKPVALSTILSLAPKKAIILKLK